MKKYIHYFAVPALLLSLCSCAGMNTGGSSTMKQVKWLSGTWENKAQRGSIFENWKTGDDSTLIGRSYSIRNGKDTVVFETIQLRQRNGALYYVPIARGQNNNQPVPFKMTLLTKNQMVFENPEHDFPKRIIYKKSSDNRMDAAIEGEQDGQMRREDFPFVKVK